jgi:hypothetical protein
MSPLPVLALVRDLIFATKISTAARSAGVEIKMLRDPQKLPREPGRLLLVDLNQEGAIEAAAAWREKQGAVAIGFVSHVDAETIFAARSAGIDRVLARSQFVKVLQDLLIHGTMPASGGSE